MKALEKPELMCLYWTGAGVYPGRGEISRFDFLERVEAASAAGFTGLGLWHTDLEHILIHRTLAEMKTILEDHGIVHLELEFLTDWFLEGARKAESDSRKRRLLEASEALGAKHIKIGDFYNSPCPMPRLVESFAALCEEAKQHGATIGFEIMGAAVIDNIDDAIRLVRDAACQNGGIILDVYQAANLGMTYDEISRIPIKHLVGVELNDGLLPGNPKHDPSNRRFCGEGEYDLQGFIQCIEKMGYTGPWAVEIIAETLADWPLKEMCARSYDTTIAQFSM